MFTNKNDIRTITKDSKKWTLNEAKMFKKFIKGKMKEDVPEIKFKSEASLSKNQWIMILKDMLSMTPTRKSSEKIFGTENKRRHIGNIRRELVKNFESFIGSKRQKKEIAKNVKGKKLTVVENAKKYKDVCFDNYIKLKDMKVSELTSEELRNVVNYADAFEQFCDLTRKMKKIHTTTKKFDSEKLAKLYSFLISLYDKNTLSLKKFDANKWNIFITDMIEGSTNDVTTKKIGYSRAAIYNWRNSVISIFNYISENK